MHTVKLLTHFVEHHQSFVYGLIFLGLILEGDVILIATGILTHLGALDIRIALLVALGGGITKTFFQYYLGGLLYLKCREWKFISYLEKRISTILPHFHESPFWSIFISKFITGTNITVAIFSGYKKLNMEKYLKAEVVATLVWIPSFILLGYFFSYTAIHITHEIWKFAFIILLFIAGFIIVDRFLTFLYELFEEFHHAGHK